jgi:hypothetical protein
MAEESFLDKLKNQYNFYNDYSQNKLGCSYYAEIAFDTVIFIAMPEIAQKDAVTYKLALLIKEIEADIKKILEM